MRQTLAQVYGLETLRAIRAAIRAGRPMVEVRDALGVNSQVIRTQAALMKLSDPVEYETLMRSQRSRTSRRNAAMIPGVETVGDVVDFLGRSKSRAQRLYWAAAE